MSDDGEDERIAPVDRMSSLIDRFFDRFGGEWLTGTPRGELPIYKQPPDSPAVRNWTPPRMPGPGMRKLAQAESRLARGCVPRVFVRPGNRPQRRRKAKGDSPEE
jgi:hypothetical protein